MKGKEKEGKIVIFKTLHISFEKPENLCQIIFSKQNPFDSLERSLVVLNKYHNNIKTLTKHPFDRKSTQKCFQTNFSNSIFNFIFFFCLFQYKFEKQIQL